MKVKMYIPLLLLASGVSAFAAPVLTEGAREAASANARTDKRATKRAPKGRRNDRRFRTARATAANAALKEKLNPAETKSLQAVLADVSHNGGLEAVHGVISDHVKQLATREDLTVGQVLTIARALEREAGIAQLLAKRFAKGEERAGAYDHIIREFKDAQRIVAPYAKNVPAARNIHERIERRVQKLEGRGKFAKHSPKGPRRVRPGLKERAAKRSAQRAQRVRSQRPAPAAQA